MFAPRKDFSILKRRINGKPLVYLDNAATAQKPKQVLDAMTRFYETKNANVHRGVYTLSVEATEAYESARATVARFINADPSEIVFVRNATEGINLVARSFVQSAICNHKSEIVLSEMEHHSNMVPWMQIIESQNHRIKESHIRYIPVGKDGELDYSKLNSLITTKTSIVSVTHASNVLGTINDIPKIVKAAHKKGVPVLVDAAQSVPHMPVDVKKLGCDFLVFSGHKMYGPTGIGVLWARRELFEKMQPFLGGGDMIRSVRYNGFEPNEVPWKFEAGTPNVAGAIGLAVAVKYVQKIGMKKIQAHEQKLTEYALKKMGRIPGMKIYGPSLSSSSRKRGSTSRTTPWIPDQVGNDRSERVGLISFNIAGIHPHDLATLLDEQGVAIRAGHMCAEPLVRKLGEIAVTRVSFSVYSTKHQVDVFVRALEKATLKFFCISGSS